MKLTALSTLAALSLAVASTASFAANATVGATVFGPNGGEIGKVEQVANGNVVINTGSVTAAIPADSLSDGENGLTIGWSRAELEAAVNAANAQAGAAVESKLVAGTEVYSSDGVALGKVAKIEGDLVVVELKSGASSLPKAQMTVQGEKLTFLATAADIEAAVAAQGGD